MSNLQSTLKQRVSIKTAALKTGTVTRTDTRGLIVTDDASGAQIRISGSARIGDRVSYRYAALVSTIPEATVTVVMV